MKHQSAVANLMVFLALSTADFSGQSGAAQEKQGSIKGVVTDVVNGARLSAVELLVMGTEIKARTDAEGNFATPPVPPGTYVVTATAEGYESEAWSGVRVEKNREVYLMFKLKPKRRSTQANAEDDSLQMIPLERMPEPVGGMEALARNVWYPDLALKAGIEGTVYTEAIVNEKGVVESVKILQSPHAVLNESAATAVKKTKFSPGIANGKPARAKVTIPIRFRLSSEKERQEGKK